MNDKFEYSDFYKFITSVGVALIVFSFVLPWAFLREKFDLLVTTDTINRLSPEAARVIGERQHIAADIFRWLPTLFGGVLALGLLSLVVGSRLWWRRQTWRDRAENAATQAEEQKLQPQTVAQRETKADVEALADANPATETALIGSSATQIISPTVYLEIENRVGETLRKCFSQTHEVLSQQYLGVAVFDFILRNRDQQTSDLVIELKVRKNIPNFSWWVDSARAAALSAQTYTATLHKNAKPFLLVIVSGPNDMTHKMIAAVPRISQVDSSLAKVKVLVVSEKEFFDNDCYDTYRLFGI